MLCKVDECTREALAYGAQTDLVGCDHLFADPFLAHGTPAHICSAQGSEFIAARR